MRIGSLQNVNIEQWTPTYQRTEVQKLVPGFIVAQTYDVVARTNTLTITGYLVGTSQSSLASQIMTLKGFAIQKRVVWIDATDQYQGLSELVRITNLQGPTIDGTKGTLTADFTLQCSVLLPWGTTLSNPFRATGIVLRDLNGQGAEYTLNPLEFDCNYQLNEIGQSAPYSFSWEFILDNQNPFTNATSTQECACTALGTGTASATNPIATNNPDNIGYAFDSISIDNSNYPENLLGSLKGTKTNPAGSVAYIFGYDFGTTGINISAYDRLRMWYRCDQVGQPQYQLLIVDKNGNYYYWTFGLQAANTWMNAEVSFANRSGNSGTPDLTAVRWIGAVVSTSSSPPASINVWLGDIRVEIGYINHCEDTSGWAQDTGTGTFVNDTRIFKTSPQVSTYSPENRGASLKIQNSTDNGSGAVRVYYTPPVSGWNISSYDFFLIWIRSDFGGNTSGQFNVNIGQSETQCYQWQYPNCNANQWYRFVVPLRNPTVTIATPNLTDISMISIQQNGAHTAGNTNLWIDEIALDVGNSTYVECMLPDNIAQNINPTNNAIQVSSWNGSAYQNFQAEDAYGGSSTYAYYPYYLNGSSGQYIFNTGGGGLDCSSIYAPNTIGNAGNKSEGNYGSSTLTYTTAWGTNNRFGFMIKMPPATSDSITGNLPSDDLSGFAALNKVRLKIVVYFSNDDCSYMGN